MHDSEADVRSAAGHALRSALSSMRDNDADAQSGGQALRSAPVGNPTVAPVLLAATYDSDAGVRNAAAAALSLAASSNPTVLQMLVAALQDSDPRVRTAAVDALGSAVGSGPSVVPALRSALEDSDADVRNAADRVLRLAAGSRLPDVPAAHMAEAKKEQRVEAVVLEPDDTTSLLGELADRTDFEAANSRLAPNGLGDIEVAVDALNAHAEEILVVTESMARLATERSNEIAAILVEISDIRAATAAA